jgi:hypothetical protein
MSTLHLPEGYQYKFHPAKRAARHQHVLETLTPHIPTLTLGILVLTLLQWHSKPWIYRIPDILAYAGCLILHGTSHPLLALCLATLHTTWSILPGSFASLNLPSHARFMAETKFTPPPHASEEEKCIICWDEETSLAHLPCNHTTCASCLTAMGSAYQTACPLCKHPLFTKHDHLLLFINKASLAIQSLTTLLHCLILWDEIQHLRYWNIFIDWLFLGFMGWITVKAYFPIVTQGGENWWRPHASSKGGVGRGISMIGFSFVLNAAVLGQTVYANQNLFL